MLKSTIILFGPVGLCTFIFCFVVEKVSIGHEAEAFMGSELRDYVVFDKGRVRSKHGGYNYLYLEGLFSKKVKIHTSLTPFEKGDEIEARLYLLPSNQMYEAIEIIKNNQDIYTLNDSFARLEGKKTLANIYFIGILISGLVTIFWYFFKAKLSKQS